MDTDPSEENGSQSGTPEGAPELHRAVDLPSTDSGRNPFSSEHPPVELPTARSRDMQPKLIPFERPDVPTVTEKDWGSGDTTTKIRGTIWMRLGVLTAVTVIATGVTAVVQFSKNSADSLYPSDVQSADQIAPGDFSPEELLTRKQILEQFLDTESSIDDRLALLREPFDPAKVRNHFEEHSSEFESGIASIEFLGEKQMLDLGYHRYNVTFQDRAQRSVYVIEESDRLKIDWDAYARTEKTPWAKLLSGNVPEAEMQVFLSPGRYFNFDFSDSLQYSMFVLTSPDCDKDLFGYAKRSSLTEKVILQAISSGSVLPLQVILRLEDVDGSSKRRQFLISHVVATAWVESRMGTVENLWVGVEFESQEEVSFDEMEELAGRADAPRMFQMGHSMMTADPDGAARYFTKALELQDDFVHARLALGIVLVGLNRLDEAEAHLKLVISEESTNPEAHFQLALCSLKRNDFESAVPWLESTVRYDPNHLVGLNNLTWLLATDKDESVRTQPRIVTLAEHAAQLVNESVPSVLATLAVAYAAVERFEEAVTTTEKALTLLRDSGNDDELEAKLTKRLVLFQNRKPYIAD